MSAKTRIIATVIGLIIIGASVVYAFKNTPLTNQAYRDLISITHGN